MADVAPEQGTPARRPRVSHDPSHRHRLRDDELVQRVAEGDRAALGALYDRYGRQAYTLARRICGDDVTGEDVVQEVFITLWHNPRRFDPARGSFAGWLLTIVHHKAVDSVRRESVIRRHTAASVEGDDWSAPLGPGADHAALGALDAGHVRKALGELPSEQRRMLALAYFGGYTQREVAAMTGVPLGTVKSRMFTGIKSLRSVLGPLLHDTSADAEARRR